MYPHPPSPPPAPRYPQDVPSSVGQSKQNSPTALTRVWPPEASFDTVNHQVEEPNYRGFYGESSTILLSSRSSLRPLHHRADVRCGRSFLSKNWPTTKFPMGRNSAEYVP